MSKPGSSEIAYVTGGRQRRGSDGGEEWCSYDRGIVVRVDLGSGTCTEVVEYESPSDVLPEAVRATTFRSGSIADGVLTVCTQTEVIGFGLDDFARVRYVSLPLFNDLHHAATLDDGSLLVVNTGLDMVIKLTSGDEVSDVWSVLDADPWQHFSASRDYRKVVTTKPHRSHPNHAFTLGSEVWVTRFEQRDAVCLNARRPPISIQTQSPHDGIPTGDSILFTTVDGHLIEIDRETLAHRRSHALSTFHSGENPRGWCRGLLPRPDAVWVGYSRLRPTRFRKNISWLKHTLDHGAPTRPTSLVAYDLERRSVLAEIDLEPYELNTIFSILTPPDTAAAVLQQ